MAARAANLPRLPESPHRERGPLERMRKRQALTAHQPDLARHDFKGRDRHDQEMLDGASLALANQRGPTRTIESIVTLLMT